MNHSILCCLVLLSTNVNCKVWEFGTNAKDNILLASYKSEGPVLERTKQVDFHLPSCYIASYMKIEVNNPSHLPKVNVDWDNNSIKFNYNRKREGEPETTSSYSVIVKGKYERKCKPGRKVDKAKIRPELA